MPLKKINELLKDREFISVASCDTHCRPNAAPKIILKLSGQHIYLVDYTIGKTWENLTVNPVASLSFMDTDQLIGYQLNGSVEIIDRGKEYELLQEEFLQKEISLSTKRIIEGIYRGKKHESFELSIPERFVIFKMKIAEIVEIGSRGELKREKVC